MNRLLHSQEYGFVHFIVERLQPRLRTLRGFQLLAQKKERRRKGPLCPCCLDCSLLDVMRTKRGFINRKYFFEHSFNFKFDFAVLNLFMNYRIASQRKAKKHPEASFSAIGSFRVFVTTAATSSFLSFLPH